MDFIKNNTWLIPVLPLIAAAIVGLFGRKTLKGLSHFPIWAGVLASAICSFMLLGALMGADGASVSFNNNWFHWFSAGDVDTGVFSVEAGAWIDPLTVVMLCVVCGIGFLITVFAAGYMKGEQGYWRFFAYLGLFIFSMTCLVMGDNLVMLYLGWEGVGLCSYALIGYYYDKPAAREAAKKAFIVNRIGDFGFAIGIMLVWYCFGTVSYFGDPTNPTDGFVEKALLFAQNTPGLVDPDRAALVYWIPFALMLGAFGKSAQFPLHVWLPDAMEGPTPVSALIHAATMVTAGVYMIARLGPVFTANADALTTIAVVGCITAILGGTIALRQFDLKKVFAYSTVSQLGFMFVALGALAPVAGVFHVITHAFFKALLFLSSGVVMHAMLGHLDLRKMSGIRKQLPMTAILMGIGCLALAGFPLLSGFWSKDEIVVAAGLRSPILKVLLLITALLTAYYTFRVYFRVFFGPNVTPEHAADGHHHADGHDDHGHDSHSDHAHHNHEPMLMIAPLVLLAVGAIMIGIINLPFDFLGIHAHSLGHFLGQSPSFSLGYEAAKVTGLIHHQAATAIAFGQTPAEKHAFDITPLVIGSVVAVAGIGLAWFFHLANREKGDKLAASVAPLSGTLEHKYFVDELYAGAVVAPTRFAGKLFEFVDRFIIDGIVLLIAGLQTAESMLLKSTVQRGYLQGYALAGIIGIALILFSLMLF
jgi:NADH-quinone oxidoreductase subunit L